MQSLRFRRPRFPRAISQHKEKNVYDQFDESLDFIFNITPFAPFPSIRVGGIWWRGTGLEGWGDPPLRSGDFGCSKDRCFGDLLKGAVDRVL